MPDSVRVTAERILAGMRHTFKTEATYRRADPSEFPNLDFRAYRVTGDVLLARGFRHLVDLEQINVSTSPNSVIQPTLMRAWVSADGTIVASHYQTKQLWGRKIRSLLTGIANRRWIAAPSHFFRTIWTRDCVGFSTELEDGTWITTSNAELAALITTPPTIRREFHPYGTPALDLLRRHEERLAVRQAESPSLRRRAISTVDEMLASCARSDTQKAAHRAAVGWLTREELRSMSPHSQLVADAVFNEVQKLLRENGLRTD